MSAQDDIGQLLRWAEGIEEYGEFRVPANGLRLVAESLTHREEYVHKLEQALRVIRDFSPDQDKPEHYWETLTFMLRSVARVALRGEP